jgi:hypothetical protein
MALSLFATCYGLLAYLLSWPMLALLVDPGTDLVDAWTRTADVPLTFVIMASTVGYVVGYRRNSRGAGN